MEHPTSKFADLDLKIIDVSDDLGSNHYATYMPPACKSAYIGSGNERKKTRWLKKRDPTRPVQYEHARWEATWTTHDLETIDAQLVSHGKLQKFRSGKKGRSEEKTFFLRKRQSFDPKEPSLVLGCFFHGSFVVCFGVSTAMRIRILTSFARCTPAIKSWPSMVSSMKAISGLCR